MKLISINYKIIGEGIPIVMIHGWRLDHQVMLQCMEPVFEKLNGWKRIYIDLPGMGDSESQEFIRNSDDMLDYVLNFLDTLISDEPFMVCGQSYGGYLARGITNYRKKNLRGLLLICPMVIPNFNERCVPEEICEFEQIAVINREREWKRVHDEILLPSKKADSGFLEKIRQCGYGFSFDFNDDGSFFQYPVLVITGRQDAAVGYLDALQFIPFHFHVGLGCLSNINVNSRISKIRKLCKAFY